MRKYSSRGWFAKVAVSGVVLSVFSIAVFTPLVNAPTNGVIGRNNYYFAANNRSMQAVFNVSIECMYLADPVNGNMSKVQSSSKNIVTIFYDSSDFYAENLLPGKYLYFSDNIPHKTSRQVCLVLDLPPPAL